MPRLFVIGYVTPLAELDSMANVVLGMVPHSPLLPGCSVSFFSAGSVPLMPHVLGHWPARQQVDIFRNVTSVWTRNALGAK